MRILVTGGCGFIGSNFIRYLLDKEENIQITNLDKLTYAGQGKNIEHMGINKNKGYNFVEGDICDINLVDKLVMETDGIIHFAAESHVDRSIKSPDEFERTNVCGTLLLLNRASQRGNKRFHHISTDEVFGALNNTGKFNENTHYDPRSPYSASKAAADHFVRAYFHTYRLPVTISNCSNNYGPYQFPEKIIPLFITNLIEGKKVSVYGNGLNVRDWIHVEDHCEAIWIIYSKGKIGETYCIGGGCEKRNIDLTREILKEFNVGAEMIEFVTDRKGHDFRYAVDSSKIQKELGWKPKYTFKQGLAQTIQWYKDNQDWWRPLK